MRWTTLLAFLIRLDARDAAADFAYGGAPADFRAPFFAAAATAADDFFFAGGAA